MKVLLPIALLWPAVAGLLVWFMPAAKDRIIRGRMVTYALIAELVFVIAACFANGSRIVVLQMTPSLQILL